MKPTLPEPVVDGHADEDFSTATLRVKAEVTLDLRDEPNDPDPDRPVVSHPESSEAAR